MAGYLGFGAEFLQLLMVVVAAGHAPDVHEGQRLDRHHGEGPVEEERPHQSCASALGAGRAGLDKSPYVGRLDSVWDAPSWADFLA
jgi:hypothetical protein